MAAILFFSRTSHNSWAHSWVSTACLCLFPPYRLLIPRSLSRWFHTADGLLLAQEVFSPLSRCVLFNFVYLYTSSSSSIVSRLLPEPWTRRETLTTKIKCISILFFYYSLLLALCYFVILFRFCLIAHFFPSFFTLPSFPFFYINEIVLCALAAATRALDSLASLLFFPHISLQCSSNFPSPPLCSSGKGFFKV